jgi:hypothetical protein
VAATTTVKLLSYFYDFKFINAKQTAKVTNSSLLLESQFQDIRFKIAEIPPINKPSNKAYQVLNRVNTAV